MINIHEWKMVCVFNDFLVFIYLYIFRGISNDTYTKEIECKNIETIINSAGRFQRKNSKRGRKGNFFFKGSSVESQGTVNRMGNIIKKWYKKKV